MRYDNKAVKMAIKSIRARVIALIVASVVLLVFALATKNRLGDNDVSADQAKALYLCFFSSALASAYGFWLVWFVSNLAKWVILGRDHTFQLENMVLSKDTKSIKRLCRFLGNTWVDKEVRCLVFDGLMDTSGTGALDVNK